MSVLEMVCYVIACAAIVILIGTAGAMETDLISQGAGTIRSGICLAVAGGSILAGRRLA